MARSNLLASRNSSKHIDFIDISSAILCIGEGRILKFQLYRIYICIHSTQGTPEYLTSAVSCRKLCISFVQLSKSSLHMSESAVDFAIESVRTAECKSKKHYYLVAVTALFPLIFRSIYARSIYTHRRPHPACSL